MSSPHTSETLSQPNQTTMGSEAMRGLFLGAAGVALALIAATGAWAGDPGVTDKEIKLGSFLPLQSGLSAGASQYRDGMESYLKYINDQGGIKHRKRVVSGKSVSDRE